jgi:hypothetical protein
VELIEITESGIAPKQINGFTGLVKEVVNSTAGIYTAQQEIRPTMDPATLYLKKNNGRHMCV